MVKVQLWFKGDFAKGRLESVPFKWLKRDVGGAGGLSFKDLLQSSGPWSGIVDG